jgi:D-glycero-alpha-D-manno-heptose-7-phosphate kinase
VVVNPLRVRRDVRSELEASLLLYFGGVSRDSADVIAEQQRNVISGQSEAIEATHAIRWEARTIKDHLVIGDIAGIAKSLRDGWEAKKKLATQISNPVIERAYDVATEHGMIAGKVSGAGGGGFMMMLVDPRRRLEVTQSLERDCGGAVLTCHFTDTGVESWRSPSGLRASG